MLNFLDCDSAMNTDMDWPDLYFTPEYGKACECSDNAIWECCIYKDLLYVYLKQPIKYDNITYYDLITPYGYSGYYYEKQETFDTFLPMFRNEAKNRNYLTEVIRQNPYISININNYDIITTKTIYAIKTCDIDEYFKNTLNSKTRNIIKKGYKKGYIFEFNKISKDDLSECSEFRNLYNKTMEKVQCSDYYYFNNDYYEQLESIDNLILTKVKKEDGGTIGMALFFSFNNFLHYHLSCNDNSDNSITNFLLHNTLEKFGLNKTFIIGCGLKNGDNLSRFKQKISTNEYDYIIYKNVLNNDIYNKICNVDASEDNNYFPKYRQ